MQRKCTVDQTSLFRKVWRCGEGTDRSVIIFVCRFTLFVERGDIAFFSFAGQSPNANTDWLVERLWLKQILLAF